MRVLSHASFDDAKRAAGTVTQFDSKPQKSNEGGVHARSTHHPDTLGRDGGGAHARSTHPLHLAEPALKEQLKTAPVWPLRVAIFLPEVGCQTRAVLSLEAEAMKVPSRDHAQQ